MDIWESVSGPETPEDLSLKTKSLNRENRSPASKQRWVLEGKDNA
jgi:hypothetical protein